MLDFFYGFDLWFCSLIQSGFMDKNNNLLYRDLKEVSQSKQLDLVFHVAKYYQIIISIFSISFPSFMQLNTIKWS